MFVDFMKRLSPRFQMFAGVHELRKGNAIVQAAEIDRLKAQVRERTPGNLALAGYKVYSQTDEDGIIDAIFQRVPHGGSFVEIGVQTGIECNTLTLLLRDWRGVWIDGDTKAVGTIRDNLGGTRFPGRFRVDNSFVHADNIARLIADARAFLGVDELDFLSLDIDGTDVHVMDRLLASGERPKVVCIEYNGKFPLPIVAKVRYAPDHSWDGASDYMGSSLQAMLDMFAPHGYRLLTCNIPGINAFFIRDDLAGLFDMLPPADLYQPFRIHLSPIQPAQPPSLGYLKAKFADEGVTAG